MTFGFHISYWAVFWELAPYLAIPAGLVLLLFAGTWVSRRSPRNAVRYLLLGVLALLVAFAFMLPLGQAGAGWTYASGEVRVNTGYGSAAFTAGRVNVRWVTHLPGYHLASRTDGTSTAHLQAGHFTLNNGLSANVFEYHSGRTLHPVLALSSNQALVLVSSPSVARLMAELQAGPAASGGTPVPQAVPVPVAVWMAIAIGILGVGVQAGMAAHYRRRLPATMAVHFGLSGKPDQTAQTSRALFMGPAIGLGVGLVGLVIALGAPANWTGVLFILPVQAFMVLAMYWMYRMNLQISAS